MSHVSQTPLAYRLQELTALTQIHIHTHTHDWTCLDTGPLLRGRGLTCLAMIKMMMSERAKTIDKQRLVHFAAAFLFRFLFFYIFFSFFPPPPHPSLFGTSAKTQRNSTFHLTTLLEGSSPGKVEREGEREGEGNVC